MGDLNLSGVATGNQVRYPKESLKCRQWGED